MGVNNQVLILTLLIILALYIIFTFLYKNISATILPSIESFTNQKELVSVVIPTYDRFNYLLNTISSVKRQTYPNIEIIVVNDCSTQEEYYRYDWAKDNVNIVHLPVNSKVKFGFACSAYVRNIGIMKAKGKYVAFCDDDDIWFSDKITIQLNVMKSNRVMMSCTDAIIGNGMYNSNKQYKLYNKEYYYNTLQKIYKDKNSNLLVNGFPTILTYQFLNIHNCIITSSVVIEKYILDNINNFKLIDNKEAEDYDCWLRALNLTDCIYIDKPLVYYDNGHGDGQDW